MRSTSIPSRNSPPGDAGLGIKTAGSRASPAVEERTEFRNAGRASRIEPQFNTPPVAKPTYEELRALAALYDRPAPRRRTMVRTGLIALIFVVGITVGFVITAWLSGEAGDPVRTSFSGVRAYQRGISEGELPYDGRTVDAAARRAPEAETGINMQELPYGGVTSSGASMDKSEVTEHESLPLQSSPEPTSEVVPEVARKAETPPQAPVPAGKQGKRNVSHSEAKASPAPQHRRKTQRRNEKDREIQRIRQQAEDELKKKTDRRLDESRSASRGAGQKEGRTETASRSTRVAAMSAMLQQCELAGNLFRREYCKWQLCSGKWGKNGCPSYPSRSNPY